MPSSTSEIELKYFFIVFGAVSAREEIDAFPNTNTGIKIWDDFNIIKQGRSCSYQYQIDLLKYLRSSNILQM